MARLLIVYDDAVLRKYMKDVLFKYSKRMYVSKWPLQIEVASGALQALELIKEYACELIITDILMARMDGWEFIKELRKNFPQFDTPIVVVSAIEGVDLKYESMKHGASAWFRKPFSPKEFAAEVFTLIQER